MMATSRHNQRAGQEKAEDAEGRGPTPETKAKLKSDVVLKLYQAKRLTREQFCAAEEIRQIWEAMGRGMFPSSGALLFGAGGGNPGSPVERLSEDEEWKWKNNYTPWAKGIGKKEAIVESVVTYSQLVYDVVVDNRGPSQLEKEYKITAGKGKVTKLLQTALTEYAVIAGWLKSSLSKTSTPNEPQPRKKLKREFKKPEPYSKAVRRPTMSIPERGGGGQETACDHHITLSTCPICKEPSQ